MLLSKYVFAKEPAKTPVEPFSLKGSYPASSARIGVACSTAEEVAKKLLLWQKVKLEHGRLITTPAVEIDFTRKTQFHNLESKLMQLIAATNQK